MPGIPSSSRRRMTRSLLLLCALSSVVACKQRATLSAKRIDISKPFAIVGDDVLARTDDGVVRVTASGETRWTFNATNVDRSLRLDAAGLWLTTSGSPEAFVLGPDADSISTVDLLTGRANRTVNSPEWVQHAYRGGDALYSIGSDRVVRIDPSTGATRWTVKADCNKVGAVATSKAVWCPCHEWTSICGFDAEDGHSIATFPTRPGEPMVASDDGSMLFRVADGKLIATDLMTLKDRWVLGRKEIGNPFRLAVTQKWLLVASLPSDDKGKGTLSVLRREDGATVWSRTGRPGAYLGNAGIGDQFVAFSSDDSAMHVVRLPDGREGVVHRFRGSLVIGPDATGMSPGGSWTAPIVEGRIVLLDDSGDTVAYAIGTKE